MMDTLKRNVRVAGALYVALGLIAPFALLYVPRTLIVRGDAADTARRILASEMLFRLGIVANLTSTILFLFMAMALYRVFKDVDRTQASIMVALAVMPAPLTLFKVVNDLAALTLLRGADFLAVFTRPQLEAMALVFLDMHRKADVIAQIFWGLWLFPLGILVIRSGFIPRLLGVLLLVNGATYVVLSLTYLLAPSYAGPIGRYAFIPETGELWFMLWLLFKGASTPKWNSSVTET
jgi:hypothetical protein